MTGRPKLWLLASVSLALLATLAFVMFRPIHTTPLAQDPRFVITSVPQINVRPGAGLFERAFIRWLQIQQKVRGRSPGKFSFPASPMARCSIQGFLNQCTEVTGVRYVMPKDVAAGTVQFGPSNVLTGPQWAKAFTDALQHSHPQWWDSQARKFMNENLVLVTNDARTVLVLPQSMASEFQLPVSN